MDCTYLSTSFQTSPRLNFNEFRMIIGKAVNYVRRHGVKFLYAGFMAHWGTVSILINGYYYGVANTEWYMKYEAAVKAKCKSKLDSFFGLLAKLTGYSGVHVDQVNCFSFFTDIFPL